LALVYDGGSRSAGARAGGVGLQTLRDWVLRFDAAGPAGLVDGKAPGQAPRLDQAQRRELAQLCRGRPDPCGARCGSLATVRSGTVGDGDVLHIDQRADAQSVSPCDGLPSIVGTAAASRAEP